MKPPKPLPTAPPFLTLWTPTFRRPRQLALNLASVGKQTIADQIQQIVVPDHIGLGVAGGLYGQLPWYAQAFRGEYVNFLCDDDVIADEKNVERIRGFARARGNPPVIVCRVLKGSLNLPACDPIGEPQLGSIDLTSFFVRGDVWHQHVGDYGLRYEGDYDHAMALWRAGHPFAYLDLLYATGGASHGRPEGDL